MQPQYFSSCSRICAQLLMRLDRRPKSRILQNIGQRSPLRPRIDRALRSRKHSCAPLIRPCGWCWRLPADRDCCRLALAACESETWPARLNPASIVPCSILLACEIAFALHALLALLIIGFVPRCCPDFHIETRERLDLAQQTKMRVLFSALSSLVLRAMIQSPKSSDVLIGKYGLVRLIIDDGPSGGHRVHLKPTVLKLVLHIFTPHLA